MSISKLNHAVLLYRHCQLRQASCIDDLQFAKRFPGVLAKNSVASGKLKLFPMGTLQAVKDGTKGTGHAMEGKGQKYTISGPKCDLEGQEGALVPFFWVKPTTEKAMANMVATTAKSEDGTWTIPGYKNSTKIEAGKQLLYYKPKDEDNPVEQPSTRKRQKTS